MQEPEKANLPTRRTPSVLAVIAGPVRPIDIDYEACDIHWDTQNRENVSGYFNEATKDVNLKYDYVLFIGAKNDLRNKKVVGLLVDYLESDNRKDYVGVYTDLYIVDGHVNFEIFNQSFNHETFGKKTVLNFPFMVRSRVCPLFTDGLKYLYLYDGILTLSQKYLLAHIPSALFVLQDAFHKSKLSEDMKLINESRNKNNSSAN